MNNFNVTELAITKLVTILNSTNDPNASNIVRIGVKGGGSSGYSYVLETHAKKIKNDDIIIEFKNFKIHIDKRSMPRLNNTILDYKKSLMYNGFEFKNPNVKNNCGCGQSFSV